jgi:ribosome-associated translation inhibitor RaiA
MAIVIEGVQAPGLRRLIERRLEALRARLPRPPVHVRVGFTDENGPKGGIGTRCAITVEWPRRPALHAEDVAPTPRHALDAAFEAIERLLLKELDRQREQRRRPKKYFVAKRLLETEPGAGEAEGGR